MRASSVALVVQTCRLHLRTQSAFCSTASFSPVTTQYLFLFMNFLQHVLHKRGFCKNLERNYWAIPGIVHGLELNRTELELKVFEGLRRTFRMDVEGDHLRQSDDIQSRVCSPFLRHTIHGRRYTKSQVTH